MVVGVSGNRRHFRRLQQTGGNIVAGRIELSDLISSLRAEIDTAWAEGAGSNVAFEAGPIGIELTTEIEVVSVQGKVAAKFWVLTAEAGADHSRTNTQKVTFSITPRDRHDPAKPLLITGVAPEGVSRKRLPEEGPTPPEPAPTP